MRITARALVLAGAGAIVVGAAGAAEAKRPKCFGERATLVYGRDDGYAPGTDAADVIVVRGTVIATEGRRGDDLICVRRSGPVSLVSGGPGDDLIDARAGSGFLSGGGGNDAINAGQGDDYLYTDRGDDRYRGGRGEDTVDFNDADSRVRANLEAGVAIQGRHVDALAGVESLWGSRFSDTLVGDPGRNVLAGGGGADVLVGLDGHDLLFGFRGKDTADGGASRDRCDAERMSSCERRFPPLPDFPDD